MNVRIKQALLSVSDKTDIIALAQALTAHAVTLLSTGGTARLLAEAGIAVTEIGEYTGVPEILDGRVKTLHPKIHAGILARRDRDEHMQAIEAAAIAPIDLVVVNLYPFAKAIARPQCTLEEAIENIDIGGPAMVRAAAKNYRGVVVLTDPSDYAALIDELERSDGSIAEETRFRLARKAFAHTAAYDAMVSDYLASYLARDTASSDERRERFPETLKLELKRLQALRYGENPHQEAAFYRDPHPPAGSLARYRQLQGKELSYNNIADSDAAWECVKTFERAACVIVKHANPCGVAEGTSCSEAYTRALATDREAAFGGIIAFNRALDGATAQAVCAQFVEVVIAPEFDRRARDAFAAKANVRLLELPMHYALAALELKSVGGGVLVQTPDARNVGTAELKVVTRRAPTREELDDLLFVWRVAKFVKSNAIVFGRDGATLAIGAGQMSRADSARIAAIKAANSGLSLAGSRVASDAFFPFRDGLDLVADAGATAVIQPGGSVRDAEVIAAADERGIAMVFTGVRHFRH